jgi:hypothetical protein
VPLLRLSLKKYLYLHGQNLGGEEIIMLSILDKRPLASMEDEPKMLLTLTSLPEAPKNDERITLIISAFFLMILKTKVTKLRPSQRF